MEKIKNNPLEKCEGDANGYTRRSASSSGENDFFPHSALLFSTKKKGILRNFPPVGAYMTCDGGSRSKQPHRNLVVLCRSRYSSYLQILSKRDVLPAHHENHCSRYTSFGHQCALKISESSHDSRKTETTIYLRRNMEKKVASMVHVRRSTVQIVSIVLNTHQGCLLPQVENVADNSYKPRDEERKLSMQIASHYDQNCRLFAVQDEIHKWTQYKDLTQTNLKRPGKNREFATEKKVLSSAHARLVKNSPFPPASIEEQEKRTPQSIPFPRTRGRKILVCMTEEKRTETIYVKINGSRKSPSMVKLNSEGLKKEERNEERNEEKTLEYAKPQCPQQGMKRNN